MIIVTSEREQRGVIARIRRGKRKKRYSEMIRKKENEAEKLKWRKRRKKIVARV